MTLDHFVEYILKAYELKITMIQSYNNHYSIVGHTNNYKGNFSLHLPTAKQRMYFLMGYIAMGCVVLFCHICVLVIITDEEVVK